MSEGWIYCFMNASMKDIYKVGMTTRHPSQRLLEANQADTWRPPTPYVPVLTRKVTNVREKEATIHGILSDLGYRLHPRREFFNAPLPLIEKLFGLTDEVTDDGESDDGGDSGDVIEHEVEDETPTETAGELLIKHHEDEVKNAKVDIIRNFLSWFREKNPTVQKIQAAELYTHYCTWCDETDIMLIDSLIAFGKLLSLEKSCPKVRTSKGFIIYVNLLRKKDISGNNVTIVEGGDSGGPTEE